MFLIKYPFQFVLYLKFKLLLWCHDIQHNNILTWTNYQQNDIYQGHSMQHCIQQAALSRLAISRMTIY
jgi:hypothetical protein